MSVKGLRRALLRLREGVQDVYTTVRGDFAPMSTLDLHTFGAGTDMSRYQVTTDSVLGGRSTSSFVLKRYEHFMSGCFSGALDFHHDEDLEGRGGFASFRTLPDERVRDLSAFEAFELRVKTDGRPYTLNFKCADHSPEQLWQCHIVTPTPFVWTSVAVPFQDLRLTRRGRVELAQLELNRETVCGFGVLLADGRNGPFRFEMQYLRALRRLDSGQWQSPAERAFLEAGGGGASAPAQGVLPSPTPNGALGSGLGLQEAAAAASGGGGDGAAAAPAADHQGVDDGAASPPPPARDASREEWANWYKKMRAGAKMVKPPVR